MAKRHQQDQQNLTFDEMMRFLDGEFQRFPEHRTGNAVRYELADVLKSAFTMFSLKSPSLLDFKKQTIAEESNLHNIFRIEGAIPCDNQMRGMLDALNPSLLQPLFHAGFLRLRQAGIVREYQYWQRLTHGNEVNLWSIVHKLTYLKFRFIRSNLCL